jgi:uncharacterized protein (DUF1499 family)
MEDSNTGRLNRRVRAGAAMTRWALAVGLTCGAAALLAGPGYRSQLLPLGIGLQVIRWAATCAIAGLAMAMLALVLALLAGARVGIAVAAGVLGLNALVAGPPLYVYWRVNTLPHIHDLSTDTGDPPSFVAVVPLRAAARYPLDYKPETAAQQRLGYPDIATLRLDTALAEALGRAERAARSMGWEIVSVWPTELRIEATDTTLLFGFEDDVAVRIRPQARAGMVDVRSVSRVGGSDFGTNAKRIRSFLRQLTPA